MDSSTSPPGAVRGCDGPCDGLYRHAVTRSGASSTVRCCPAAVRSGRARSDKTGRRWSPHTDDDRRTSTGRLRMANNMGLLVAPDALARPGAPRRTVIIVSGMLLGLA